MKDLSLNVLDITHNSISAEASLIELEVAEENGVITITIKDNGKGIDPEMLKTVTDPFTTSRTTRKVGMGLPLFKMAAEQKKGGRTVFCFCRLITVFPHRISPAIICLAIYYFPIIYLA